MSIADISPEARRVENVTKQIVNQTNNLTKLALLYDKLLYAAENSSQFAMIVNIAFPAAPENFPIQKQRDEIYELMLKDLVNQIEVCRSQLDRLGRELTEDRP